MSVKKSFLFHPMRIEQNSYGKWEVVCVEREETTSFLSRKQSEKIEIAYSACDSEQWVFLDVQNSSAIACTSVDGTKTMKYVRFMAQSKLGVLGAQPEYYQELFYGRQHGKCDVIIEPAENRKRAGDSFFKFKRGGTDAFWSLHIFILQEQLDELFSAIERKVFSGNSQIQLELDKRSSSLLWSDDSYSSFGYIDTIDAQEFISGFDEIPDKIKKNHFVSDDERLEFKGKLKSLSWKSSRNIFDS